MILQDQPAISHDVYDTNNGDDSKDLVILDEEVSKSNKGKAIEVIHQILDKGYDTDDLMIIGEEVYKSKKGKKIEAIHQEVSDYTFCQPAVKSSRSVARDVIYIDDDDDDNSDDLMIIGEDVSKTAKKEHLNNVDKAIPNKMKSTAPTPPISANFKSAKKEHLDNVDISYKRPRKASNVDNSSSMNQVHVNIPSRTKASFTSFGNFGIGLRQGTFESSTWYDTYDYDHDDYDDYDEYDDYDDYDDTYDSTSTYQYTSNMRKSTALTPITSNFRSVKKEEH
ncbi:hypothetical protein P8452_73552 [Trifolium repens]|nr:hypothetical protein P8452_73552 [Trifolium repens]